MQRETDQRNDQKTGEHIGYGVTIGMKFTRKPGGNGGEQGRQPQAVEPRPMLGRMSQKHTPNVGDDV